MTSLLTLRLSPGSYGERRPICFPRGLKHCRKHSDKVSTQLNNMYNKGLVPFTHYNAEICNILSLKATFVQCPTIHKTGAPWTLPCWSWHIQRRIKSTKVLLLLHLAVQYDVEVNLAVSTKIEHYKPHKGPCFVSGSLRSSYCCVHLYWTRARLMWTGKWFVSARETCRLE